MPSLAQAAALAVGNIYTFGAGGGATALPSTGTVAARWSADDITPQGDNTAIASWTAGIGGMSLLQATGIRQPKYRTNRIGTKPSVQFTGAMFMDCANASLNAIINANIGSVFVVFKTQGASTFGVLFLGGQAFLYGDNTNVGNVNAPTNLGRTLPYAGQTAFSSLGFTMTTPDPTGGGTGNQRYGINGGCVTQNNINMGSSGTTSLQIGCDPGINFGFVGEIFDVIIWSTELTPPQILQAHKWACDKYSQAYPWAAQSYFPVFDGDSITVGSGSTGFTGAYPYKTTQSLGLNYGQYSVVATGSITMSLMTTRGPTYVDPFAALTGKPIKLAAFEWYNQRAVAPGPQNNSIAYNAARKSAGIKLCFGTSTDTSVASDPDRANYNAYFDANHAAAQMDSYVPIHNDSGIGLETAFANFPANFFDTVHLSDAGYTILAGLMTAGLNAIP